MKTNTIIFLAIIGFCLIGVLVIFTKTVSLFRKQMRNAKTFAKELKKQHELEKQARIKQQKELKKQVVSLSESDD